MGVRNWHKGNFKKLLKVNNIGNADTEWVYQKEWDVDNEKDRNSKLPTVVAKLFYQNEQ